jgi:tetratricopeptide (TPR) repeat protein
MQGAAGNLFQGNNVNLGVGGGISGFGGGQLGQFGNLGGQFGIQGNDQSPLLVALIQAVVARGEWIDPTAVLGGAGATQQNQNNAPADPANDQAILTPDQLNSLGFYPPTRTLVVRATSRFYKSNSSRLARTGMGGGGVGAPINQGGGKVAVNDPKNIKEPAVNGKEPVAVANNKEPLPQKLDAKLIWEDAVTKGVTDPGLIIACTDFLGQFREFKHAGELLKASLRKGLTPEPWAQEALAIALEAQQGSPEELERARVSALDLDPKNSAAYLRASKALADMGDKDRALAFCKIAAKFNPDMPDAYVNALSYAGELTKVNSEVSAWASDALLSREWSIDQKELHLQAQEHLRKQIEKLSKEGRAEEAKKLQGILDADKQRDLVVELKWAGGTDDADLDLYVTEANGTICSPFQRHTTGGGVLHGDVLEQKANDHSETYVASQGFSGSYKIRVQRVWGNTLGNKATLRVTKHKGTPEQTTEIHTLTFDPKTNDATLVISLEGGRRTALATVPPPSVAMNATRKPENNEQVLSKLRSMTQPNYLGLEGGIGSMNNRLTNDAFRPDQFIPSVDIEYHTQLMAPDTMVNSVGMQLQAQVTRSAKNGSSISVRPVFQTFDPKDAMPKVTTVPGGVE